MNRTIQRVRIRKHLEIYGKITVPQMMRMGIAQYNTRISELRGEGMVLVNVKTWEKKRKKYHSTYFLNRP